MMKSRTKKIDRPQFISMMVATALLLGMFVAMKTWSRGVTVYETVGEIFLTALLVAAGSIVSLLPVLLFYHLQKRRRKRPKLKRA
jgi:hypothetical protein